jgi:hypothetical protein
MWKLNQFIIICIRLCILGGHFMASPLYAQILPNTNGDLLEKCCPKESKLHTFWANFDKNKDSIRFFFYQIVLSVLIKPSV